MSEEESKSPTETAAPVEQLPEWITPEDGPFEVYADWYHVNWLPYTVRIRFAQVIPDPRKSPAEASTWALDERMALTMPWYAVKTLSAMLNRLIKAYETENGEIVVPKIPNTF
jgi:hypothetical protein